MAAAKKRGLGRGLDALLGGEGSASPAVTEQEGELRNLPGRSEEHTSELQSPD